VAKERRISLSNNQNGSFDASVWQDTGKPTSGSSSFKGAAGGFKVLVDHKEAESSTEEFVASFVSKEKAQTLTNGQGSFGFGRKRQATPQEIERQGYEEGFAKGEQDGLAEGKVNALGMVERLEEILSDTESAWKNMIAAYETQIIDLISKTAEKVVYAQVQLDQEVVKRAILKAFDVVPEPVNVQINISPADYEYIDTIKEDFFSNIKGLKDVSVTPDSGICQGGCNIRTQSGEVDATLEARLETVRKSLMSANGGKKS
jgi:flagellar biosynthesis/type III secretory pathway protein FliH